MPRGAKVHLVGTKKRKFKDRRSFVSLDGHDYLKGRDKSNRYREMVENVKPFCAKCGAFLLNGELDHIQGGNVGRCDCPHNLQWLCRNCHRDKHVQVKWSVPT